MTLEQEYKQMTESILAQKDESRFDLDKILETSRVVVEKLGAVAMLGFAVGSIGTAAAEHDYSVKDREVSYILEQSGDSESAERNLREAEKSELDRNVMIGMAGLQIFSGIGLLSLPVKGRTKEVVISGEKPTEQPKE